jgi:hypothetical protein
MESNFKERFRRLWERYFPGAEWPLVFYYTDDADRGKPVPATDEWRCLIGDLGKVRKGDSLCFEGDSIGCSGGKRYLGFEHTIQEGFEYFLSCGIPGKMEGLRLKKTPELVGESIVRQPLFEAPARYIIFKRWDKLDEGDQPLAVIFFASGDVLAALHSLATFDESDTNAVISPSGSGCSSIVYHPYRELDSERPRSIMGMFDISARPYVPAETLTFTVPWPKFLAMVGNMEESFLITEGWDNIKKRIKS